MRYHPFNMGISGFCLLFALTAAGCLQYSGFQTAKTVPRGMGEFGLSASMSSTLIDFSTDLLVSDTVVDWASYRVLLPTGELWGRYGLTRWLDAGMKISTQFSVLADAKMMLLGNEESVFAAGLGAGLGYQILLSGAAWQCQLPAYVSVHPTPGWGMYISPRYVAQFFPQNQYLPYAGLSSGLELGKNVRFGIDITYLKPLKSFSTETPIGVFQAGAGMKFRFQSGRNRRK